MSRPAIFLDRDGTLSHEVGYVNHISRFQPFPFTVEAVRRINRAGWLAVVATNQAGVARGYFPEAQVHEIHAALERTVEEGGGHLDAIYVCLHHPDVGQPPYRSACDCRKPRPGLLKRAEAELGADLTRSWVIGDRYSDVELAWRVGGRGALVKTGYGLGETVHFGPTWTRQPDLVAENALEAVSRILDEETP